MMYYTVKALLYLLMFIAYLNKKRHSLVVRAMLKLITGRLLLVGGSFLCAIEKDNACFFLFFMVAGRAQPAVCLLLSSDVTKTCNAVKTRKGDLRWCG